MTTRIGMTGMAFVSALSLARVAAADDAFAKRGEFVVSAERLFGFAWSHTSTGKGSTTTIENATIINRLTAVSSALLTSYSFPSLAFDYFATESLTLGLAAGYFHTSTNSQTESQSSSDSRHGPSFNGLLLSPRVGYAYMFAPTIGIWPRAGLTYLYAGRTGATLSEVALTLEVALSIVPFPHVAFWIGPTLDLGLTGSVSSSNTTGVRTKTTDLGVQTGLCVYF
jgi:hypothetical protein